MAGPSDGEFRAQLMEAFARIFTFLKDVIPCMTALRESGISPQRAFGKGAAPDAGIRALQRWLDEARGMKLIESHQTETAAFAIIGALQTRVFFSHVIRQDLSAAAERKYLDELADLFCRSLGARAAPPRRRARHS